MKLVRLAALGAALATAVAFAGVGRPEGASGESPASRAEKSITVAGTGSVTVTPDQAGFSFGVTTKGRTATQALNANAAEMRAVIAALKAAGVAAADIQTAYVSLSPFTSEDGETIVGYAASNTVSAQIRDIGRSGAVIDAAVSAGANQVSGPSLTRSDQRELYRKALQAAFADARAKAQTLAAAGGVKLGGVRTIVESSAGPPPPVLAAAKAAEGTPIEPGTQTIDATVTVEFAVS